MAIQHKTQQELLAKLGISKLNAMQEEVLLAIPSTPNTVLLSPTGTGKTVAFLVPTIEALHPNSKEVQLLILVPSRELAIQIEQVIREMGSGYKANAIYGGRPISKDRIDLAHTPTILIGTPGRVADHLRRDSFGTHEIKTLVLDEFDKCLEIGFEKEMREIIENLPNLENRVLTSATQDLEIPSFVGVQNEVVINYLDTKTNALAIKIVQAAEKNKLQALVDVLYHIGNEPGIIFCNFKNTIQYVSDFLKEQHIPHGCFHGDMEQKDRERALIKFRNGTHQIILATDLAARGIDIPELNFIIHYQLPLKSDEFTHRNGRTARMHATGTAYVLKWVDEYLPEFIPTGASDKVANYTRAEIVQLEDKETAIYSQWATLFISGGRKDKISKGDIAGLFFKQANLERNELGVIELKQDCAFVAVPKDMVARIIAKTNNTRLKKKKVRISLLE